MKKLSLMLGIQSIINSIFLIILMVWVAVAVQAINAITIALCSLMWIQPDESIIGPNGMWGGLIVIFGVVVLVVNFITMIISFITMGEEK